VINGAKAVAQRENLEKELEILKKKGETPPLKTKTGSDLALIVTLILN